MRAKRVLLLEPGYPNKYPPLGLMKLAAYHRARGDEVRFAKLGFPDRHHALPLFDPPWDRIYVTTLFSFEWARTAEAIDHALALAGNRAQRVFVGGIAATLMHGQYRNEPRWHGVRFIKGLLTGAPAHALALRAGRADDFGAGDGQTAPIEDRVPDYSILDHTGYRYPVHDAYFGYASRGCVRKCAFCGVPALEGAQRDSAPVGHAIAAIRAAHGEKKDLVLMDNNVAASRRYREIIAEIRDAGFERGARIRRHGARPARRRVDFNQGLDARLLAKSPMYLREMSTLCIKPLRIAFDHAGMRKVYERAVRMAADSAIDELSNYMLYNFMDSPADLYARMRLNVALNEELGVRIWSFPMRYQPVHLKDRSHVGRHWTRYTLRSLQIMLQPTHGLVSASPEFFAHAYGENEEAFIALLHQPHAFTQHRAYYHSGAGRAVREEYQALRARLSPAQSERLAQALASIHAPRPASPTHEYRRLCADPDLDTPVRAVLRHHFPPRASRRAQGPGGARQGELLTHAPAPEEHVEDAALYDEP